MRRVSCGGPAGELSVLVRGEPAAGPSVLFVHPANLSAACWTGVIEALDPGLACVAPDLRGHGRSARQGPVGVAEWAADCDAAAEAAGAGALHLVGGSVGAAVAVELALAGKREALTLTCIGGAFLPAPTEGDELLSLLPGRGFDDELAVTAAAASLAPGAAPQLVERVAADASRNDEDIAVAIWSAALAVDLSERAALLELPCRVLAGELDQVCPASESRWFAEQAGADFEPLPGVGHLPQYEWPQSVVTAIEEQARRVL